MKYKNDYFKSIGKVRGDFVACENCNAEAVDIHHIVFRSQGGKDDVENLVALCRSCHNKAHFKTKPYLERAHLEKLAQERLGHKTNLNQFQ